ncbi:hypothetical protein HG537_0G02560 [Torulaspora globosa]|uniref:Inhibitor of growth protein 3 n=1 Tax=Torulaspora globosa TaxID=48254 RepID=A0A7H9HZT4_9SACH|nr:hypothetical protein HG537_0G02560 [Torulaspora sp. CBS 2947]
MDVRYGFLNTLEHYPCELIRGLWTLQSLDLQRAESEVSYERDRWLAMHMQSQSELLERLANEQIRALKSHRSQLVELQGVRKRCEAARRRQTRQTQHKTDKLTIKLNLNLSRKRTLVEPPKVQVLEEQEPTYCFCNNVSYGAMIACDNERCPREWFHYGCVGITKPPKGKWYCSVECRKQA